MLTSASFFFARCQSPTITMPTRFKQQSLDYHANTKPGKIATEITKPCKTQLDLSLAYTPGVAEPCRAIHRDEEPAYDYTAKGNLVAVITDGTAVLGLGNIGALAGKPVMEGKGVLFKAFADIDVFDIEVQADSSEDFIKTAGQEEENVKKFTDGKTIRKVIFVKGKLLNIVAN